MTNIRTTLPRYGAQYTAYAVLVWIALAGAAYLANYHRFGQRWLLELTVATVVAAGLLAIVHTSAKVIPRD